MYFQKTGILKNFFLVLLGTILSACGYEDSTEVSQSQENVTTTNQALTIPSGFSNILSNTGVNVYKKTYTGGQPDYVTIVDLRYGSVENLEGTTTGAPNGSVSRKTLATFWTDATGKNNLYKFARVVVNGTFFSTSASPAPIAFGLKSHRSILNYGYGLNEYPNLVKTIAFDSAGAKAATIQLWNASTFNGNTPDVVGILDVAANKSSTSNIPRTFIGVSDQSGDGTPETVLIYSSAYATQASAKTVLTNFGVSAQGMLDGGTSTGLIIAGTAIITPGRTIPHAIAIYSGKG